jgi:hypothetical protein
MNSRVVLIHGLWLTPRSSNRRRIRRGAHLGSALGKRRGSTAARPVGSQQPRACDRRIPQ